MQLEREKKLLVIEKGVQARLEQEVRHARAVIESLGENTLARAIAWLCGNLDRRLSAARKSLEESAGQLETTERKIDEMQRRIEAAEASAPPEPPPEESVARAAAAADPPAVAIPGTADASTHALVKVIHLGGMLQHCFGSALEQPDYSSIGWAGTAEAAQAPIAAGEGSIALARQYLPQFQEALRDVLLHFPTLAHETCLAELELEREGDEGWLWINYERVRAARNTEQLQLISRVDRAMSALRAHAEQLGV